MKLQQLINSQIRHLHGLKQLCESCLNSQRYSGNLILMIIDAAFTSVGVNYFEVVVPKVKAFKEEFIDSGRLKSLSSFADFDYKEAFHIWKNERSWQVGMKIAKYLSTLSGDDRTSLRTWAERSDLEDWKTDPIGKIRGVGLITYQYLRMMGGVDTVIPDKIVKRVINGMLIEAGEMPVTDDIEFIKTVENLAKITGYRPIELCWMTWFIGSPERISAMP